MYILIISPSDFIKHLHSPLSVYFSRRRTINYSIAHLGHADNEKKKKNREDKDSDNIVLWKLEKTARKRWVDLWWRGLGNGKNNAQRTCINNGSESS